MDRDRRSHDHADLDVVQGGYKSNQPFGEIMDPDRHRNKDPRPFKMMRLRFDLRRRFFEMMRIFDLRDQVVDAR